MHLSRSNRTTDDGHLEKGKDQQSAFEPVSSIQLDEERTHLSVGEDNRRLSQFKDRIIPRLDVLLAHIPPEHSLLDPETRLSFSETRALRSD